MKTKNRIFQLEEKITHLQEAVRILETQITVDTTQDKEKPTEVIAPSNMFGVWHHYRTRLTPVNKIVQLILEHLNLQYEPSVINQAGLTKKTAAKK